jgi:hypothetical protein
MSKLGVRRLGVILLHALAIQLVCSASMGIGMAVTSESNALVLHAIVGPAFAILVSVVYFRRFNYTTPIVTAVIFVGFIILVDFVVVALLILKSLDMFRSPLGTWIPFALIFTATLLTGHLASKLTPQ